MKRNEGFILQSLRARVADHRHDKSKTQHVIYEDRELAQEIPEATALLELGKGSSWRIVIPEILLGCIWWSVVQSFPSTILHSSIVEKKPCGYELLALCYTSPLLITRLPSVEKFISTPSGLLLSRICLSLALLGCHAADSVVRLSLSFIGNMFVPLILSRLWLINEPLDRYRKIYLHMLGYLLLLVLRVYWLTVDPLYSSTTVNCLAIVTCVASSIYLHYADQPCALVEEGDQSSVYRRKGSQGIKKLFSLRSCVVALGFGALLFMTNWLYGESSVVRSLIGRQSTSSTPIPFLEGIEIMLALAIGLAIVSSKKNLIGHPVWYIISVGSALSFSFHSFVGGCLLGLFSMSLWPYLLELLSYHPSPIVLAVGMETYFMLISASALVTGHDIIPGLSFFLNGRPIVLVLLSVTLIVVGIQERWMIIDNPSVTARLRRRKSSSRSSQVSFFGSVWRRLSTIDEESSTEEISDDDNAFEDETTTAKENFKLDLPSLKDEEGKRFLSIVKKVTLVLLLATIWGHVTQVNTMPGQPIKTNHQQLTVATWFANFGYTTSGDYDLQRSAKVLNATGADITGVVDCDTFYPFFGSYNMAGWLARTLDMLLYSGSMQNTGLGMLSHYHVLNSSLQLLHTNEGILHTAVTLTVNVSDHSLEYIVVKPRHHRNHMINCSQLHLQNLSGIVNTSHRSPMVFVHFTFCNYSSFMSDGWKHITDSHNEGWTVHVLYKNLIRLNYLNTGELLMAQFIIPEHIDEEDTDEVVATSNKQLELYWTKFLDRFYTDTRHKVLKYFTQT